jgi:hypothetical protein
MDTKSTISSQIKTSIVLIELLRLRSDEDTQIVLNMILSQLNIALQKESQRSNISEGIDSIEPMTNESRILPNDKDFWNKIPINRLHQAELLQVDL